MPTSTKYPKTIAIWEKGFQMEVSTIAANVWSDVSLTVEPSWDFATKEYRPKVNATSTSNKFFNIYTLPNGLSAGADSHYITGPFASAAAADAETAKNSAIRTARIKRSWTNGDLDT